MQPEESVPEHPPSSSIPSESKPQACADAESRHRGAILEAFEELIGRGREGAESATTVADGHIPVTRESGERAGTTIGPYTLREKLGEGGFGTVWLAEQSVPVRRQVAVKVVKPGMDSQEIIARFEAERQALALMEHPNIAKVLDAGQTLGGRPYFVMELVKGVPITRFCDEARLATRARLELFREVCAAVQHAHGKGIIHRDLKPSNILVCHQGTRPVPKIIDFGIAKATQGRLTDATIHTRIEQFMGTPVYMSPEQALMSALDIDTRSDIYSLGVVLYELLTGTPPFDAGALSRAGYDEMRRIIRDEEPPKPSSRIGTLHGNERTTLSRTHGSDPERLGRIVRGDLDWIVMKAIDKDRSRRYETADAFARDVERYLHDEPVEAAAPSAAYRLRKFVRRHRAAVWTAALVAATLAGATLFSLGKAAEARKAERISNLARSKAERLIEQTNEALVDDLRAVGKLDLLSGVAQSAADYFNLIPDELRTPETERLRASAIENLAEVQAATNEITKAASQLDRAIEIRRQLVSARAADSSDAIRALSEALLARAKAAESLGNPDEALASADEATAVLLGDPPRPMSDLGAGELEVLVRAYQSISDLHARLGDRPASDEAFDRFLEGVRYLAARDASGSDSAAARFAGEAILERGDRLIEEGDPASAAARYAEAGEFFEALLEQRPDDVRILKNLAVACDRRGDAWISASDPRKAMASYRLYADHMKELVAHDATNADWQRELSLALNQVGDVLLKQGDIPEARSAFSEAPGIRRALATVDPDHADAQYDLASSLFRIGELEFGVKDGQSAIVAFTDAAELAARFVGTEADDDRWIRRRLGCLQRLALAYVMRRLPDDFERAISTAKTGEAEATAWGNSPGADALPDRYAPAAFRQLADQIRASMPTANQAATPAD